MLLFLCPSRSIFPSSVCSIVIHRTHTFLLPLSTTMVSESAAPQGMAAYRAPSLFQPHRARQAMRDAADGKIPPLAGLYLGLSTVPTARFVAPLGFDMVWIDWEHSSCGVETMTTVCLSCFAVPLCRPAIDLC